MLHCQRHHFNGNNTDNDNNNMNDDNNNKTVSLQFICIVPHDLSLPKNCKIT